MGIVGGREVHNGDTHNVRHRNERNRSSCSIENKNSSTESMKYNRRATYQGSWYEEDPTELEKSLDEYLSDAASKIGDHGRAVLRGLIVPHAGYRFSGPTAAYSYAALKDDLQAAHVEGRVIEHILLLHPSHYYYLKGCAVSGATCIETPLGSLRTSDSLRNEILELGQQSKASCSFTTLPQNIDEKEHSSELQYPFLYKVLRDCNCIDTVLVTSIMCGSISSQEEQLYGQLLVPIIERRNVITIVSSDFCHWGKRFSFQPMPPVSSSPQCIPVYDYIEALDRQGMAYICRKQPLEFANYLQQTKNTICGRHAISVYLHSIVSIEANNQEQQHKRSVIDKDNTLIDNTTTASSLENTTDNRQNLSATFFHSIDFIRYEQSSKVTSTNDSSVSYAAAIISQQK